MIVGVPGETSPDESRVALVPPAAENLVSNGLDVVVAAGAGEDAGWSDEQFRAVGCRLVESREAVFEQCDVVVHVSALGATTQTEMDPYRRDQIVVGLLGPHTIDDEALSELAERGVSAFALENIPRTGRAQSMDVLTSMASIGGYKAVVMAADTLQKLFPMQMTAAGTVRPVDVFVVGAGVAGLQAIATAKRLGARVRAYDIRPEVKEEIESLGADFVELELETDERTSEDGYARERDEAFYRKQQTMMTETVGNADVLITTAAVLGKTAPQLVTSSMIETMDTGSVVVDLAADGGGNCEPTQPGETIRHEGVTVIGPTNLPSRVSQTASQLYANNVVNFLKHLLDDGVLRIDTSDDIVDATLLTHDGTIRHSRTVAEPENEVRDNQ